MQSVAETTEAMGMTAVVEPAAMMACLLCRQGRTFAQFLLAPNGFTFSAFCRDCRLQRADEVRALQRAYARGGAAIDPQRAAEFRQAALEACLLPWLKRLAGKRISKGKGVNLMPEEYAVKLAKLPDRVANIVGKTYSERGDDAELADDTAVGRIRDLLLELDETIIQRNKNKRLPRIP